MPSPLQIRRGLFGVALASMFAVVPAGIAQPYTAPNLTQLKRQAKAAADAVEKATKAMESRRQSVRNAQKILHKKLRALRDADEEMREARIPVSQIADQLYAQSSGADIGPLILIGERSDRTLQFVGDMEYVAGNRDAMLSDARALQEDRRRLAAEAQQVRSAKLMSEAKLGNEIESLKKKSERAVKALTKALAKLGLDVGKGKRCDPERGREAEDYPNGLLPKSYLCPLPQKGEELRSDAAVAFVEMNAAYKKRFGREMCVSDSYRDLNGQHAMFRQRPGLAAIPGKSNHGWGLAVDLCGGVQNSGSPQYNWLEQNGRAFGWFHPKWAYSSPFEPWHWEFDPDLVD